MLVASVPAAQAGGSTWNFEPAVLEQGQPARAWAAISWAQNPALGTPADGPWYAWLQPVDPNSYDPRPGPGATFLGEITVREGPYVAGGIGWGPNHAFIDFVVPDVPDGQYELVHCTIPCGDKYFGDITWGGVSIGQPPPPAPDSLPPPPPPTTAAPLAEPVTARASRAAATRREIDGPTDGVAGGVAGGLVIALGALAFAAGGIGVAHLRRRSHAVTPPDTAGPHRQH